MKLPTGSSSSSRFGARTAAASHQLGAHTTHPCTLMCNPGAKGHALQPRKLLACSWQCRQALTGDFGDPAHGTCRLRRCSLRLALPIRSCSCSEEPPPEEDLEQPSPAPGAAASQGASTSSHWRAQKGTGLAGRWVGREESFQKPQKCYKTSTLTPTPCCSATPLPSWLI